MSKERAVQWIIDHLFEDPDCNNPDVFNLFMNMNSEEIQEFVRVVD
jgi:hypothetical protein